MKKIIGIAVAAAFILTMAFTVDSYGASSLSSWLKRITYKIKVISGSDNSSTKRNAVAGVKGTEAENKEELYWKSVQVEDAEKTLMNEAIALAEEGKNELAIKKLEEFVEKYPESALIEDAKAGLLAMKDSGGEDSK